MDITVSQAQGTIPVTVFHINGDLSDEELLVAKAKEAYEAGSRNLLLDLSDTPYISSSGLRGLHMVWMLFREDKSESGDKAIRAGITQGSYRSRHFKLLNPSKSGAKALNVSGYDMFLEIHKNMKSAIASFL